MPTQTNAPLGVEGRTAGAEGPNDAHTRIWNIHCRYLTWGRDRSVAVVRPSALNRLPMARSRIPAPRCSPGNATRRNGASASSSHSASPSSPLLASSPRCSSPSKCAGSHFFLRFEQSAQLDGLRPRFISGYWYLAEGDEAFLIGVGQGQARGGARPKRPWTCRSAAPLAAADPRRPGRPARPCPAGAPLEKNGRLCWAAGGCWGLQIGCGFEKTPLEVTRA